MTIPGKTVYLLKFLLSQDIYAPKAGVEPKTFGLEVQRASPLRHAGICA